MKDMNYNPTHLLITWSGSTVYVYFERDGEAILVRTLHRVFHTNTELCLLQRLNLSWTRFAHLSTSTMLPNIEHN
jgi:hypothetical protein